VLGGVLLLFAAALAPLARAHATRPRAWRGTTSRALMMPPTDALATGTTR
jgi:hypothetical protein